MRKAEKLLLYKDQPCVSLVLIQNLSIGKKKVLAVWFAIKSDCIIKKYIVISIPNSNQCLDSQKDIKHGETFLRVRNSVLKIVFISIYPNFGTVNLLSQWYDLV